MLHNDQAIALHGIRYGETSLIAHLYTRQQGRQTVMVNGAYPTGKRAGKAILFQPLMMLNIHYYPSRHGGMGRFKEAHPYISLTSLPHNHIKRALALFISEVIYRTVREEEANPSLYQFLESSIEYLDNIQTGVVNFHLAFLVQLSRYIGFYPSGSYSSTCRFFNIKTGHFEELEPLHPQFFNSENSKILSYFLQHGYDNIEGVELNGRQRVSFLKGMLDYYSYHLGSFAPINSLQVLSDVFET